MINVIGRGLAGSMTARFLRDAGHEVRIIADEGHNAASFASSNLWIEHWLKRFSTGDALQLVQEKWGHLADNPFKKGLGYAAKVKHIGYEHILLPADYEGRAKHVDLDTGDVTMEDGALFGGDATVLCLGYRNHELWPDGPDIDVKAGHAFFYGGVLPKDEPSISMIAPYRHQKWYQLNDTTIYYADSTAIKLKRYEKERDALIAKSRERAEAMNKGRYPLIRMVSGYRPLIKGHDFGAMLQAGRRTWMINGGGKNGMVAYADCANRLLKEIPHAQ